MSEKSDSDADEGFLDGDIVDNIFNQKDSNAHLEMDFESATKYVRGMAGSAKQEDLLFFYGRYKQATVGPCDAPKPSFYQITEKSKWNAWNELGNKSRVEAQLEYIQKLSELEPEWLQTKISEPGERGWVSVSLPTRDLVAAGEETVWDDVQSGNFEKLKLLAGPLTQYRDENGLTLLHWATDRGHLEIVKMLLDRESELLNLQENDGQTCLHYAASNEHQEIVNYLLSRGADAEVCDNDGLKACNDDTDPVIAQLFRLKVE